jgi:hypothetical protein
MTVSLLPKQYAMAGNICYKRVHPNVFGIKLELVPCWWLKLSSFSPEFAFVRKSESELWCCASLAVFFSGIKTWGWVVVVGF